MIENLSKEKDPQLESEPDREQSVEPKPSGSSKKKFDIDIFRAWCKSCGICAAFCPKGCIRLDTDGSLSVEDADCCTGCGWCELHCPDFAISVRPRKMKKIQEDD